MNKVLCKGLHLLIISTITAVFGVLTAFGVSAEVGERFTVNTIEYKITSEGAFPEVEVAPYQQKYSLSITTLPEFVANPSNNLVYRVTSIGNYAFADCKDLSKVYCNGLNPPHAGKYVFDYCSSNLTIYVPKGTIYTYVAAGWPEANLVEQV